MRQEKSDLACTCGKVIFKEVISNMLKMFPVDSTGKLSMIVEETRAGISKKKSLSCIRGTSQARRRAEKFPLSIWEEGDIREMIARMRSGAQRLTVLRSSGKNSKTFGVRLVVNCSENDRKFTETT